MPPGGVTTPALWRWCAAGTLLFATAWLSAAQVWDAGRRRDDVIRSVVGDETELRRALQATSRGLEIRFDGRQRGLLYRELSAAPLNGDAIALAALDQAAPVQAAPVQAALDQASPDQVGRGGGRRATRLTRQALRVEPRTRLAWLTRLYRQMQDGDTVAATVSALRLLAIDSRHYSNYLPVLATLARDPRATAPIARVLHRAPIWRTRFLERLAAERVDPAIRYALVHPAGNRAVAGAGEDAAFIADLVNKGDIDRAYLAWISVVPDTALRNGGMPYDSGFDGLAGPPPFNWQVTPSGMDRATLGGGALEISYSGQQNAVLARQIVLLDARGSYRLESVLADVDPAASGGATLAWQLSCLPGRTVLAVLPLVASRGATVQRSGAFVVPPEQCAAVVLTLAGTPGDVPARITARISTVALRRVVQ